MEFNHIKFADIIEEVDERNFSGEVKDFYGININKEFMPTIADTTNLNPTKYKIVRKNRFLFSGAQTGRDNCIRIGLYSDEKSVIVSPSYMTFELNQPELILPEYFFMLFHSKEMDRYGAFLSDGSVRANLDWNIFLGIEIDVPSIDIQSKYVAVYKAMLANQQAYEQGLDELKLACDIAVEKIKKNSELIKVDELVEEIDNRNIGGKIMNLQGINITKNFMPSLAKINKKNIEKYKVVNKNEFAYSAMQTGRDECIRIALYGESEPCIVSPAYSVLAVKSPKILPEYFMKWFSRKESDRHGAFISDSSVRASLDLSEFLGVEIPVPDLDIQKSIVDIYKVYLERKAISEKLKEQIKNICPVLIKGATDEAKKLATAS